MTVPVLNRVMVLQQEQRVSDEAGGFVTLWQTLGSLWARVEARSARAAAGQAVSLAKTSYRITVRAAPVGTSARPIPGQRLVEGSRLFAIEAVTEADPQGRYLICHATEEVAQ